MALLYKVVHYDKALSTYCTYDCMHARLDFSPSSLYPIAYTTGKDAYISPDEEYWHMPSRMLMAHAHCSVTINSLKNTLFISSSCKLPRDLVRNSGYKIVRDKDRADYVVIPRIKSQRASQYEFNIGFIVGGTLALISISRTDGHDKFDDSDIKSIKEAIEKRYEYNGYKVDEFIHNDNLVPFSVQFLQKCEEYEELFYTVATGSRCATSYVLDANVQLVGSNTISVETLEIWRRMNERDILEKSIINSDWQKYPCTMAVFLKVERPGWCVCPGSQFRWLLKQIDYDEYAESNTFKNKTVAPEDWNMLQKWIMYRTGLSENGGFIALDKNNCNINLDYRYHGLIMSRLCIAPMMISEPETFKNLQARSRNA